MKLLIIVNNIELSEMIEKAFHLQRFVVEVASSYTEAITKIHLYKYDCILLDVMLPDGAGLSILKELKSMNKNESVIIISARDFLNDKVEGLELETDDYLPKPFHMLDSEDLGTIIPTKIKVAFGATKYSNASVWNIVKVELGHNYSNNGIESFYEVELENIKNPTHEVELLFSSKTGQVLYSQEKQENNNNNKGNDEFMVNAELKTAIPNAGIIENGMMMNI